jgi:hypothetical protein
MSSRTARGPRRCVPERYQVSLFVVPLDAHHVADAGVVEVDARELLERGERQARGARGERADRHPRQLLPARLQRLLGGAHIGLEARGGEGDEAAALMAGADAQPERLAQPGVTGDRRADGAPHLLGVAAEQLALERHGRELPRVHRARVVQRAQHGQRDLDQLAPDLAQLGFGGRGGR